MADGATGGPMAGTVLGWPIWIGVVCRDLEAQRSFYRDVLGFKEIDADVADGWVIFDGGWPRAFELQCIDERPWRSAPGYRIGYEVGDVATARMALIASGVESLSGLEGGPEDGGLWAYFRDPEGIVFEVTQRLGDAWEPRGSELGWPIWIGTIGRSTPAHFDFYRDLTGWDEIDRAEEYTWLDAGGPRLFEPLRIEGEPPYEAVRTQVGFEVEDVAETRARLVQAGVEPVTEVRGGWESLGTWAYLRDPEGNTFSVNHRLQDPSVVGTTGR